MGFKKVLDLMEEFAKIGAILTFSVMSLMGILQVLSRYVAFGNALYFTEEMSRYMFVWAVFLASAVCMRKQQHAAIELFVNWMPPKVQKVVLIIALLCCILFFGMMIVYGFDLTQTVWSQSSPAMEISMGLIYAAIPIGGLLMLVFSLESMVALIKNSDSQDKTTHA